MHNVLHTSEIHRALDALKAVGADSRYLIMNAALAIADGLTERAKVGVCAIFCGTGTSGIIGITAAIRMHRTGLNVVVVPVGDTDDSEYTKTLAAARSEGVSICDTDEALGTATVAVDAIAGIDGELTDEAARIIDRLNAAKVFRLAADIPSGLDPETGEVRGTAFRAHITLAFACYKYGMLFGSGREYCGDIIVEDIGLNTESDTHVYEHGDFKPHKRDANAHKGTVGRIFVIGGCAEMVGAPILAGAAAHAAHLNGAGTVTVCVPKSNRVALASRCTMSMMKFLPDTPDGYIKFSASALDGIISKAKAIDIGMGMGKTPELRKIIGYLCQRYSGPLIIDADALNALAGDYDILRAGKAQLVLTPHVGEFTRLTGKDATIENAKALAAETNAIVVLKSATTIITDGKEVRINITGTPAMAKGGTGDVLGGCITALTCSYSVIDAATIACYRNGMGARRAVSSYAEMMLTPRDILRLADYDELN